MDIGAISKAIFEEAKDVLQTWISVIGGGSRAVSSLNLESRATFYALTGGTVIAICLLEFS